jgi:hypothetical protein
MTEEPSELTQQEPARPERRGRGLARIEKFTVTTPDGERSEPVPVITTVHQPRPEPPPRWRPPQSAREEARRLRAQAQEADSKAADLERDFDSKIRRVESLQREIQLKEKELGKLRQQLGELNPDKLRDRLELAYFRRSNFFYGDNAAMNQWLDAAALRANAKELRAMLTEKIENGEHEIAEAEAEVATLEAELEANAGSETV